MDLKTNKSSVVDDLHPGVLEDGLEEVVMKMVNALVL